MVLLLLRENSTLKLVFTTIGMGLAFILIIIAAYYTTKFIATKSTNITKSKHINIIERMPLSKDKWLFLIEINKEIFLLGVTTNNINIIHSFSADELEKICDDQNNFKQQTPFSKYMDIFMHKNKQRKEDLTDDFSIQDIKRRLDKIRHQS